MPAKLISQLRELMARNLSTTLMLPWPLLYVIVPVELPNPMKLEVLRPQGGYIRGRQSEFDVLPRTRTPDHVRKNDAVCPILTRFS
jgi:hypothetical protein